jgi:hypothetical protein
MERNDNSLQVKDECSLPGKKNINELPASQRLSVAWRRGDNNMVVSMASIPPLEIPEKLIMKVLPEQFGRFAKLDKELVELAQKEHAVISQIHEIVLSLAQDLPVVWCATQELFDIASKVSNVVKEITLELRKKGVNAQSYHGMWPSRILWVVNGSSLFTVALSEEGRKTLDALGCTVDELLEDLVEA